MRGAGRDRGLHDAFDLTRTIGDPGKDRCDQDTRRDPGVVERPDGFHPGSRAGCARLRLPPDLLVHRPDGEGGRDVSDGGRFRQQVDVAKDERALVLLREQIVVKRRAHAPDVERAGGRGREADADRHDDQFMWVFWTR